MHFQAKKHFEKQSLLQYQIEACLFLHFKSTFEKILTFVIFLFKLDFFLYF